MKGNTENKQAMEKMKKELKSLRNLAKDQKVKTENLEILNTRGRTRSQGRSDKIGELEQKLETLRNENEKERERMKQLTEENRIQHQRSEQAQEETKKRIQDFSAAPKEGQTAARVIKEEQDKTKACRACTCEDGGHGRNQARRRRKGGPENNPRETGTADEGKVQASC